MEFLEHNWNIIGTKLEWVSSLTGGCKVNLSPTGLIQLEHHHPLWDSIPPRQDSDLCKGNWNNWNNENKSRVKIGIIGKIETKLEQSTPAGLESLLSLA